MRRHTGRFISRDEKKRCRRFRLTMQRARILYLCHDVEKFSTSGKKYIWLDDLSAGDYYIDETEYLFDESDVKIDILLAEGVGLAECSLANSTLSEADDNRDLLSIRLSKDRLNDMIKLIDCVMKKGCTSDYYLSTITGKVITLQFVLTNKDAVRIK